MRAGGAIQASLRVLLALLLVALGVPDASADGGRLRFREPAGPFIVTLFTAPDPLLAGRADFSVAVERADQPRLVPDARVDFILTSASGHVRRLVLHASRNAATSKWLQAANFSIPSAGLWRVTVIVSDGRDTGRCSGDVRVEAGRARGVLWDVLPVPLAALLFVLHERRKRSRNRRLDRAAPA